MDISSFKEDHISQLPAIQLLQKLRFTYLNQEQALELRGSKTTNVLLEDILRKQQKEINSMDKLYVVEPDDLFVNIAFAWEQAIAIVKPEDDGALASHRFPTFTFIAKKGHSDFFRFFILQPRMKYALDLISPGGAGRNRVMSKSDFIKLGFLLPEYNEQTAIAQLLQTADKEIQLLNTKMEKLKEQKKGLMQQLLTGKKRLKYGEL